MAAGSNRCLGYGSSFPEKHIGSLQGDQSHQTRARRGTDNDCYPAGAPDAAVVVGLRGGVDGGRCGGRRASIVGARTPSRQPFPRGRGGRGAPPPAGTGHIPPWSPRLVTPTTPRHTHGLSNRDVRCVETRVALCPAADGHHPLGHRTAARSSAKPMAAVAAAGDQEPAPHCNPTARAAACYLPHPLAATRCGPALSCEWPWRPKRWLQNGERFARGGTRWPGLAQIRSGSDGRLWHRARPSLYRGSNVPRLPSVRVVSRTWEHIWTVPGDLSPSDGQGAVSKGHGTLNEWDRKAQHTLVSKGGHPRVPLRPCASSRVLSATFHFFQRAPCGSARHHSLRATTPKTYAAAVGTGHLGQILTAYWSPSALLDWLPTTRHRQRIRQSVMAGVCGESTQRWAVQWLTRPSHRRRRRPNYTSPERGGGGRRHRRGRLLCGDCATRERQWERASAGGTCLVKGG